MSMAIAEVETAPSKKRSGRRNKRHKPTDLSIPNFRSRLTTGNKLIAGLDQRSKWARRFRDLLALHLSDLGGEDAVSTAELSILRRAVTLTVLLERFEAEFAAKEGVATEDELRVYQMTSNTLRRHLESLGLKRRAKDVTPNPLDYASRRSRQADDAEVGDD